MYVYVCSIRNTTNSQPRRPFSSCVVSAGVVIVVGVVATVVVGLAVGDGAIVVIVTKYLKRGNMLWTVQASRGFKKEPPGSYRA